VTIIKKVIKLAWDSLPELVAAIWEMAKRAIAATREFAQYLVDTGRLGVTRSERYIGSETVGLAHYFLLADHYKIFFAGIAKEEEDDTVWPSVDKAIGFVLWHALDELGVKPTSRRMAEDAGEPFDDYWVYNVQRQERGGRGILPWAPAAVRRAAAEDGEPLPWGLRRRYETALGTELDGVRLHTGPAAAAAADALDARAYTIGRHIHFGNSEFAPGTSSGDRLLAHELAHAGWAPCAPRRQYGFGVVPANAESERRAQAAARRAVG
jgi:hypothetical protein